MTLATVIGILMVPVTFSVVEYLSHRMRHGGKGTTMDSHHVPEPLHSGDRSSTESEGGQA
jgi:HAE1 family hydrophobic/amphiphilic exporter-1